MVLLVDAVNFHLAVFGVKLQTQCTSNNFIETDVYDYVQLLCSSSSTVTKTPTAEQWMSEPDADDVIVIEDVLDDR